VVRRRRRTPDGRAPLGKAATPDASGPVSAATAQLVSVIVVCWNSADVLGRCLDHLFAQDYANREIIVVDDGSTDATPQVARQAFTRGEMTLVRSDRNGGCPSARNLGLRHAEGEIVAFIDADGFAAVGWLGAVVAAFGDDRRVGGIASTVFYDDSPMVVNGAGGTVNRQGWAADLSMNESYEDARIAAQALYPMGCGMALRREALQRVGPFDDRMLNYYDDVDYGTRLWRAGYRIAVAPDAWIDHGSGAVADSARKRLLCERHRMRIVLKHAPASTLATWAAWEARGLRAATTPVRVQKLRSIAWNVRHLPSALASRRRLRDAPSVPDELLDASWGDGFPVGMPLRLTPAPQHAGARIDMSEPRAADQLLHGWFPAERVGERSYRWAATSAAALVRLDAPARRLRLDYAHVPVDIGGVDVSIRRVDPTEPLAVAWKTRLDWQYVARSIENHPLALAPGDYEVRFAADRGWCDPPHDTRSLSFALSSLSFMESFALVAGGLDMAGAGVEGQLVNGWYEAEDGPLGRYRWASGRAAAVVRVAEPVRAARLSYRLAPASIGSLHVALTPLDEPGEIWSSRLPWRDDQWHEDTLAAELAPGDYLLSLDTETTWSNPEGLDPMLGPENRSLGVALSLLSFSGGE
jgi:GT2 family glycosyltransferase